MLISDSKKIKHVDREGGWSTGQENKRAELFGNESFSSRISSINYFEFTFKLLPSSVFYQPCQCRGMVPS